jgi:transcriptional regulator with XRE-family HTH domain
MVKPNRTKVGKLLREYREERNLTQGNIAECVGVSVPYLSDLERGNRSFSAERLSSIAGALKLGTEEMCELFSSAGCLPPKVVEKILQTPKIWLRFL